MDSRVQRNSEFTHSHTSVNTEVSCNDLTFKDKFSAFIEFTNTVEISYEFIKTVVEISSMEYMTSFISDDYWGARFDAGLGLHRISE
jgi:hypothetical protein